VLFVPPFPTCQHTPRISFPSPGKSGRDMEDDPIPFSPLLRAPSVSFPEYFSGGSDRRHDRPLPFGMSVDFPSPSRQGSWYHFSPLLRRSRRRVGVCLDLSWIRYSLAKRIFFPSFPFRWCSSCRPSIEDALPRRRKERALFLSPFPLHRNCLLIPFSSRQTRHGAPPERLDASLSPFITSDD